MFKIENIKYLYLQFIVVNFKYILKHFRQIYRYDQYLGHTYTPNIKTRLVYGNNGYFIETDNLGFRNSKKKEGSKLSIIALGDSYTAGDGVENNSRFTDILEAKYDCTIHNLAVSGYGVDQQILAYQKFADTIPHQAILLTPHLDDLKRNLLKDRIGFKKELGQKIFIPKPYFECVNDELKLKNIPVPREWKPVDPKLAPLVNQPHPLNKPEKYLHPEFNSEKSDEWILMFKLLDRLDKLARGRPVLIAPIPFNDSILRGEAPLFLNPIRAYKKFQVIDVSECLQKYHNREDLFLPICKHFTPKAHELIAEQLSKALKSNFDIKKRKTREKITFSKSTYVLGVSCFYHDSAAALIKDGTVLAAAQEERFTRIKHDRGFPINAINYCLEAGKININQLNAVVYYDCESLTIERVLHNSLAIKKGNTYWDRAKKGLFIKLQLPHLIREQTSFSGQIFKAQHHISHAASAFYPSPFESAAILVIDGVGEWACSTIAQGENNEIKILKQQHYPNSIGLLYSAFTYFCGFEVNSGEYKLMGLAPYGQPKYVDLIKGQIVQINNDGSILLNLEYLSFLEGEKMVSRKLCDLFDGRERLGHEPITKREMDIAASIQQVVEEVVAKMANHAFQLTGEKKLVMAGGVALNCVVNGKLFDSTPFEDIFFQPAAGDAGGALGCALEWYYKNHKVSKRPYSEDYYLGPAFSSSEIEVLFNNKDIHYHKFKAGKRAKIIAEFLFENNVVGYFDGKMEFGPRALGARSILANPLDNTMQSKLNKKIKFRESFRPFAPVFSEESTQDFFNFDKPSPHMLVVRKVHQNIIHETKNNGENEDWVKIVNQPRSTLPAITHVDYTARLQSVNEKQNKKLYEIIKEFEKLSGKAVLINTSFNIKDEPIVCTPEDAFKCFMATEMDVLVMGDYYLLKQEQSLKKEYESW